MKHLKKYNLFETQTEDEERPEEEMIKYLCVDLLDDFVFDSYLFFENKKEKIYEFSIQKKYPYQDKVGIIFESSEVNETIDRICEYLGDRLIDISYQPARGSKHKLLTYDRNIPTRMKLLEIEYRV